MGRIVLPEPVPVGSIYRVRVSAESISIYVTIYVTWAFARIDSVVVLCWKSNNQFNSSMQARPAFLSSEIFVSNGALLRLAVTNCY